VGRSTVQWLRSLRSLASIPSSTVATPTAQSFATAGIATLAIDATLATAATAVAAGIAPTAVPKLVREPRRQRRSDLPWVCRSVVRWLRSLCLVPAFATLGSTYPPIPTNATGATTCVPTLVRDTCRPRRKGLYRVGRSTVQWLRSLFVASVASAHLLTSILGAARGRNRREPRASTSLPQRGHSARHGDWYRSRCLRCFRRHSCLRVHVPPQQEAAAAHLSDQSRWCDYEQD